MHETSYAHIWFSMALSDPQIQQFAFMCFFGLILIAFIKHKTRQNNKKKRKKKYKK